MNDGALHYYQHIYYIAIDLNITQTKIRFRLKIL